MMILERPFRGVLLGLAAGMLPLAAAPPASAGPMTGSVGGGCRDSDSGAFDRLEGACHRRAERRRKSPFEHYAHNPGDLTTRPVCPPYCSPTAGYFEPCWHRLPPGPGCPSPGLMGFIPAPAKTGPSLAPPSPSLAPPPAPAEADEERPGLGEDSENGAPAYGAPTPAAPAPDPMDELEQIGGDSANLWRESY